MRAENVTGPIAFHGESPVWWPAWGGLRFVDAHAADLLTLTAGDVERLHTHEDSASFVRPREGGGYVLGTLRGLALSDTADAAPTHHATLLSSNRQQMNDGGITPDGELLVGSMSNDGSPSGFLFKVSPDLSFTRVLDRVACSNGVGFTASGSSGYYVDTLTSQIDAFDYAGSHIENRRLFAKVDPDDGLPDGLTVDRDGNVWVAIWGASEVRAYSPAGEHVASIELPVRQVSACTFGDDDLGTLYITTSRQGLTATEDREAGSLFRVRTGTFGVPATAFAG
ncbi:SMP-30/gluconolactonase/LRE family protein [Salinibacterium sp. M195]|uniref:SMP-30/gluconolactonase/LRE family protein n=1 Tax=Salinibacterium sp. M195 TaxID=2583374 RepID=UPI001C62830D|nr:SMP-30/gluconolactonase/LRE family protein [Salinibacterium sp. M195]QYH36358.1 SMP-30/gluconolactonase/LRE family protein [Salinibacterium sp. M195]